jgi:hypothetical protein
MPNVQKDLEAGQGDPTAEANCSRPTAFAFTIALQRPMTSHGERHPSSIAMKNIGNAARVSSASLDNVAT